VRFKAMINRPIVTTFVLIYICVGANLVVGLHRWLLIHQMNIQHGVFDVLIPLTLLATCFPALYWSFPRYYEVREDGLFMRRGSNMNLIPYESIYELSPISPSLDSFWPNRILIMLMNGKTLSIAVTEQERFLTEIFKVCPQLEHKGASFGV